MTTKMETTERQEYTTDGKVTHYSKDEEINDKLGRIIGENFIKYRKDWNEIHKLEKVSDFPLFLQIHPNQTCNYKCPHCLIGQKQIKKEYVDSGINWDTYKKIILEGEEYDCPSISIQGWNEPLLMKDLEEYISYASKHGFIDIMLNSNGSLLTEERARKILDSGLTRIRFSLDAITKETYKKVRLSDEYDKVVNSILRFIELRDSGGYQLPVVGVSFCKIATNQHEVEPFMQYWDKIVDLVSIQTFMPPVQNSVFNGFYASDQKNGNENIPSIFKCPQPFERVDIHNSAIFPCCYYSNSKMKIGDLENDTIYQAWNSKKAKSIRHIMQKGEYWRIKTCKDCVSTTFSSEYEVEGR